MTAVCRDDPPLGHWGIYLNAAALQEATTEYLNDHSQVVASKVAARSSDYSWTEIDVQVLSLLPHHRRPQERTF